MMGVLLEQAGGRNRAVEASRHGRLGRFALFLMFLAWAAVTDYGWAMQQHELVPHAAVAGHETAVGGHQSPVYMEVVSHGPEGGPGAASLIPVQHVAGPGAAGASEPQSTAPEHPSAGPAQQQPQAIPHAGAQSQAPAGSHSDLSSPQAPAHPQGKVQDPPLPGHTALPGHGEEVGVLGEHGPALPEISPTPGVTFVETMIALLDHELEDRTLGWRPNDVIVGRFTDNINNYQLGVLEALRFTTLRLKDSLTRMGDADSYDPDLEQALNLLMNRATLFWFPSAETAYGEAADHLRNFSGKLRTGQRNFYYRVDNLRLLISSYKDLLGNVNRSLIRSPVSHFETDDYFYYAKGVAHVYYQILRVVRVGYKSQLASTLNALDIMDEIIHELHKAEQIDPWIVLDSDLGGFFANHRANLNAPLSEVAHLLGVMSSF